jgi:acyl carrier protein
MDIIDDVKKFVFSELAFNIPHESISLDDNLLSQGIIDSMGIMQLVSFIEEKYGISVLPEDVVPENFHSLNALKVFIELKQKG